MNNGKFLSHVNRIQSVPHKVVYTTGFYFMRNSDKKKWWVKFRQT